MSFYIFGPWGEGLGDKEHLQGNGWRTIRDVVAGRSVVAVGGTVVPGDVVQKPLDKGQCCC